MAPDGREAVRPGLRRVLAPLLVLLAALSVSGWGLLIDEGRRGRVPRPEALEQAVAEVLRGREATDAVAVRPAWFEDLWLPLWAPDDSVTGFPAQGLMRGDRYDAMELLRHHRVWVIGAFDREPWLDVSWLEPRPIGDPVPIGDGVSVACYALPRLDLKGRLTDDIQELGVYRQAPGGKRRPCPWRGGAHRCVVEDSWENPRVATEHVYHRYVSWVFASPGPGSQTLFIEWKAPSGAALVVRAGFSLSGIRKPAGSDTRVTTRLGSEVVDEITLAPHAYLEARRILRLPEGALPPVRFEIQAADPNWRHLMLQADVLGWVPEEVERWAEEPP
jgi:hypothetical protein